MSEEISTSVAPVAPTQGETPVESSVSDAVAPSTSSQPDDNAVDSAGKSPPEPTYEITVDGQKYTLTLSELTAVKQMEMASNKKFKEAAEKLGLAQAREKEIEELKNQLLHNPLQAMLEAGLDEKIIRDHYENVVYKMLELDALPEEEKRARKEKQELEKLRSEREQWEKERKAREEEEKQRGFNEQVAKEQEIWSTKIRDGLSAAGVVDNVEEALQQVAGILYDSVQGGHNMQLEDAIRVYKRNADSQIAKLVSGLSADALRKVLGENKLKELRKADLDALGNSPSLPKDNTPVSSAKTGSKQSAKEFFEALHKQAHK